MLPEIELLKRYCKNSFPVSYKVILKFMISKQFVESVGSIILSSRNWDLNIAWFITDAKVRLFFTKVCLSFCLLANWSWFSVCLFPTLLNNFNEF